MRDDVFSLSDELGKQYKHLRHKSAALELKQLRAFYNEAEENLQQLKARRESALQDIARFDSLGVNAIRQADNQFMTYAQEFGYLEARRRFVGEWIDELMDKNSKSVERYPKDNNLQVLRVKNTYIPTANEKGVSSWGDLIAVTRCSQVETSPLAEIISCVFESSSVAAASSCSSETISADSAAGCGCSALPHTGQGRPSSNSSARIAACP